MPEITITHVQPQDAETLIELGKTTFFQTYADRNSEADMQAYLSENFSAQTIRAQMDNPNSTFFIAYVNGQPTGYLKVNAGDAQSDLKEAGSLEIERIYVLAQHQGKNIGQLLLQTAIEFARQQHKSSIWLGVWEQNPKAIGFYEKNGFATFDKHIFIVGSELQTDHLMRLML